MILTLGIQKCFYSLNNLFFTLGIFFLLKLPINCIIEQLLVNFFNKKNWNLINKELNEITIIRKLLKYCWIMSEQCLEKLNVIIF